MSVWEKYSQKERDEYIRFLKVYGSLSNLFKQKEGKEIPYLDSKFQETIYAKVFHSQNTDIGNTPHDILSVFGHERIGIGLKTWMNSKGSFQKVMQLKRFKDEINILNVEGQERELVKKISAIKNERMLSDYERLGLSQDNNIYHYITRDENGFNIYETSYPLIDIDKIEKIIRKNSSIEWSDERKRYKFTFADSQVWQYFDSNEADTELIESFSVDVITDPFEFLIQSYLHFIRGKEGGEEFVEVYLPLYSYRNKKVEIKSGLNAWNAAPKNIDSKTLRPLNEIYIPIPKEFHKKIPNFFIENIKEFEKRQKEYKGNKKDKPQIRFRLALPNGQVIPAMVTQDGFKGLQSGSLTEIDPKTGKLYGQSALGNWLLIQVLGLNERVPVTMEWLYKKGTDSVKLWRRKDDYSLIYIDFAPIGSFEKFMKNVDWSPENEK